MRPSSLWIVVGAFAGHLISGCLPIEAEEDFRAAIPEEEDLKVKIGADDVEETGPTKLLDPYAEAGCEACCVEEIDGEEWYVDGDLYQLTRGAKWCINGGLTVAMGWVWHIVNSPASEETKSGYIWGPWQESLSRIEFRFVMNEKTDDKYVYRLEGKNINASADAWRAVVSGNLKATGTAHAVSGDLVIDYTAIHEIDTAHPTPATGKITYTFDVTRYPYTVEAAFEAFEYEPGRFLDATYSYERLDQGMAGRLSFEVGADIWPEEAPDDIAETLTVDSEWTPSGEGRSEAVMSGGSLESDEAGVARGVLGECWADSEGLFYATYQGLTVEHDDGTTSETVISCGDASHCPELK